MERLIRMPGKRMEVLFTTEIPIENIHPDFSDDAQMQRERTKIAESIRQVFAKHESSRGAEYDGNIGG